MSQLNLPYGNMRPVFKTQFIFTCKLNSGTTRVRLRRWGHVIWTRWSELQCTYQYQFWQILAEIRYRTSLVREWTIPMAGSVRKEYGSRRPCSCTRPLMELRRHTWVNWFVSPICLVDVPSALLGPIVCWYRPLNCLPSAVGPSRLPDPPSGTTCRIMWYQPRLCQPSVSV